MRPDAILHETEEHASPRVGEVLGLPVWRVECYLGAPGLATSGPFLTLSPASFDPRPGAVRFRVRAAARGAAAGLVGGSRAPLVYVSFGIAAAGNGFFPELYRGARRTALGALDVRVLMTLGTEVDPADLGTVPANVHVERWVPQGAVMPTRRRWSATAARARRWPRWPPACRSRSSRCSPTSRRTRPGWPTSAPGSRLDGVAGLGPAVAALLDDPSYRRKAGAVADEIAAHAPVDRAVDLLRDIAEQGLPLAA